MIKLIYVLVLGAFVFSSTTVAKEISYHSNGPFDPAIANETKLLEMLKRSGKISPQASIVEAEAVLKQFLQDKRQAGEILAQDLSDSAVELMSKNGSLHTMQTLAKPNNREVDDDISRPSPMMPETYSGQKRTAKILSILMEYPDFPHNSIQPGETNMYYEDYNRQHYKNLLFSKNGVVGPNGEQFISMRNYYEAQSGNSYSVEGVVAGWYMAKHPAAFYGGNANSGDANARVLVREALEAAAADPTINLSDFDIEDRYDLDGDGNFWEADGLVDHVQVFHSSVGEEAGGGQLGENAIWSHRWNLGSVLELEGTTSEVPYWGGMMAAFDYTMQPIDAAAGVISHEYGHDLGLPDEYDTAYSGRGEPVSSWSIMSSGSWAGLVPGSEPTGFSAWAKEFLQQSLGGNWLHGDTYHIENLPWYGQIALLDQAASKGRNNDAVRIDLPDKKTVVTVPVSGEFAYHGGRGNDLNNSMSVSLDLSTATTATLQFKAWYDIEVDWDYAFIKVDDGTAAMTIPGNITTTTDPHNQNQGHGITGASNGWVHAEFDLSAYAGKVVTLSFVYWTDVAAVQPGFYADDIVITADGTVIVSDNADSGSAFDLVGFNQNSGYRFSQHYYLLEWRTYHGVDTGLAHVKATGKLLPFNEGLIVWYVDSSFDDNWVGQHPGQGFLGVVDADQKVNKWSDGSVASTRYQVHDAAFSLTRSKKLFIDQMDRFGVTLTDHHVKAHPWFSDKRSYFSPLIPDAGRLIPKHGLNIVLFAHSRDKSVIALGIKKYAGQEEELDDFIESFFR